MAIPKFVSAEEYSRQSGLGVEEVKRQCNLGKLEHFKTEGGYYKIKVFNDAVPIEQYEKVKEENIRLKTMLEQIKATAGQAV